MLEGAKSVVLHGDCADRLIVSARTAGGRDTTGWTREAWPVRTAGTWTLHCIAHPDDPDVPQPSGAAFRPGT